jgi:hypothetical protein
MKKLLLIVCLFISIQASKAQVFSGTLEIEKANKEGLYTTVPIDEKYVKEAWALEIAKYGRVETGRSGVYRITGANILSISDSPILLTSRIFSEKNRTKIFVSFGFGDEVYINGGHPKYAAAEQLLNNFVEQISLQENVRVQEKSMETVSDKQKKIVKTGDKLVRAIEDNKKEKEKLLKKIEENASELEKLLSEVEQNKKDQIKAMEDVSIQQKKVEEAKQKIPKY